MAKGQPHRGVLAAPGAVIQQAPAAQPVCQRTGALTGADAGASRWFTLDSSRELAVQAGFSVGRERFTPAPLPLEALLRRVAGGTLGKPRFPVGHLRWWLARRAPRLFALQFALDLRPAAGGCQTPDGYG